MNLALLSRSSFVCRSCREAQRSISRDVPLCARATRFTTKTLCTPSSRATIRPGKPGLQIRWLATDGVIRPTPASSLSNPSGELKRILKDSKRLRQSTTVPDGAEVVQLLEASQRLSETLIHGKFDRSGSSAMETDSIDTPTSSILGLDESAKEDRRTSLLTNGPFRQRASAALTTSLRDLLCDPKVHLSPAMLVAYTRIQVLHGKPEYLPEIYHLFAHKPVPRLSKPSASSTDAPPPPSPPIIYKKSFTGNPKNAIPLPLAAIALGSAVSQKSLPIALSMIDTTVATPAFRLGKVLHRAAFPIATLSTSPFIAYTIATYIAYNYQNTYDPTMATWMFTAGIMAYVGITTTLGFVAKVTANDQMKRVVWRPGTRLRDRWLREEERAAFDQLALAWGFRERWRWGEETGEEWEALREFCGRRGMVLDKTNLLDGME